MTSGCTSERASLERANDSARSFRSWRDFSAGSTCSASPPMVRYLHEQSGGLLGRGAARRRAGSPRRGVRPGDGRVAPGPYLGPPGVACDHHGHRRAAGLDRRSLCRAGRDPRSTTGHRRRGAPVAAARHHRAVRRRPRRHDRDPDRLPERGGDADLRRTGAGQPPRSSSSGDRRWRTRCASSPATSTGGPT